jgi:hypothetical protein
MVFFAVDARDTVSTWCTAHKLCAPPGDHQGSAELLSLRSEAGRHELLSTFEWPAAEARRLRSRLWCLGDVNGGDDE